MKSGFLIIGLVALLVFSGCVKQDVSNEASQLPEIRAVLDGHPNAYVVSLFMRKDVVSLIMDDIRKECPGLEPASYWYVTLNGDKKVWAFYVDEPVSKVVCAVYPESGPLDECKAASDCDDFDAGTKNECVGSPLKCVYTNIVQGPRCVNGDGLCMAGCAYANDNDCPMADSCQTDADCSYSNSLTVDLCIGTPKHCVHNLKSCSEVRGYECEPYEECMGSRLPVSGSSVCCDTTCIKTKSCTGVACESWQKCVNGLCVKKSCVERALVLCNSSEVCTGSIYIDDFDIRCCTKECQLKTCGQHNGIVCDASNGLVCSGSTIETLDWGNCCVFGCVNEPCANGACAVNKKCIAGLCELKTCVEMGGIDWSDQNSCKGSFYYTEGNLDCCIQKTCAELGGSKCLASQVCGGTIRKSTDVEKCCVGGCLAAP